MYTPNRCVARACMTLTTATQQAHFLSGLALYKATEQVELCSSEMRLRKSETRALEGTIVDKA